MPSPTVPRLLSDRPARQVKAKHLQPRQRVALLKRGLSDGSAAVVDACRLMLCTQWLRDVEYDPVQLLGHLDVVNNEVFKPSCRFSNRAPVVVVSYVFCAKDYGTFALCSRRDEKKICVFRCAVEGLSVEETRAKRLFEPIPSHLCLKIYDAHSVNPQDILSVARYAREEKLTKKGRN